MSRFMFGQTYRSETRRREALIPGCDKECRLSNTARRIVEGTRGQGRPRQMSQRRVLLECGIGTCFSCKEVEEVKKLLSSSFWLCAAARASRSTGDCSNTKTFWDSASATGLARPSMWRMSFVNSEIKGRCRACCGDRRSVVP